MSSLSGSSSVRRRYVDLAGGQIHLRESTSPATHLLPLVMLHPTASSSQMFQPLIEILDGEYHVIAIDTPGFGSSDPLDGSATVAALGKVLIDTLFHLGVEHCSLYGNHTGAVLASWIATHHPSLVDRLMLSGPPLLSDERRAQMAASVGPLILEEDGSHLVALWDRYRSFTVTAGLDVPHRELALHLTSVRPEETFHAVINEDLGAIYRGITCPTKIVAGEGDTLKAGFGSLMELLKDGVLELTPNAGNFVVDEAPEAVANQIRSWFV